MLLNNYYFRNIKLNLLSPNFDMCLLKHYHFVFTYIIIFVFLAWNISSDNGKPLLTLWVSLFQSDSDFMDRRVQISVGISPQNQSRLWRRSNSLPVYEGATLQVAHSWGNLRRHVHENYSIDVITALGAEIIEQVSSAHELGDDEERRLACAHAEQLHQVGMSHLLHYGSLFEEIFQCHCIVLQSFHRNLLNNKRIFLRERLLSKIL